MEHCLSNRNLMLVLSEFLTFMEVYHFSCVNRALRKLLQSDEIWWPLYFREYNIRIVDRKAGGALLAYIYCMQNFAALQSFQVSQKVTIGVLGSLSRVLLPNYLAKQHFEFFDMFARPVIRKRDTFELTAVSLPNTESLEYEREYTDCFLLCVNSLEQRDVSHVNKWILSLTELQCTNIVVVINQGRSLTDPSSLPELAVVQESMPTIVIKELSEGDINAVLSAILRVTRKRQRGKPSAPIEIPAVPASDSPSAPIEIPTVPASDPPSRFRCLLV